jgi:hypothetical protein
MALQAQQTFFVVGLVQFVDQGRSAGEANREALLTGCGWSKFCPRDEARRVFILERAMLGLLTRILLVLRSLFELPCRSEAENPVLRQQPWCLAGSCPSEPDCETSIG